MRTTATILGFTLVLCGAPGCESSGVPKSIDNLAWPQDSLPPATNGAIFQAGREMVLAANPVAHQVGDIVTIVLNEQTAAKKSATTSTSKDTGVSMPGSILLGRPVTINGNPILHNSIDDSTKFSGQGASAQSNSLTGYLTATVLKVLPNGNLFIAGEKQIGLNQGKEFIRVTGIIRPIDLAADDSIPSFRVASAQITYNGKGAIADANAQSWLSRFFNSPWAPF